MIDREIKPFLPFGQYEYVDVTFGAANVETLVPYKDLKPENPELVRFWDIYKGSVYSAGENPAHVYRSGDPARKAWTLGTLALCSSVASYTTRLLLFLERE